MRRAILLGVIAAIASPGLAHAVCRVIEPAHDSGVTPVPFDPTTAVLFARASDGRVIFAAQPRLRPTGDRAALIMPVPLGATIERGAPSLISDVAAPAETWIREVVSYVEDPSLGVQCTDPHFSGWGGGAGPTMLCTPGTTPGSDAGTPLAEDAGPWTSEDAAIPEDGGALDGGALDGGALDGGVLDGGGSTDAGASSGSCLADGGVPPEPGPDDPIPVIDEYTIEIEDDLSALLDRLLELDLAPREADTDALLPYEGTHHFVLLVVEPSGCPDVPLVALRPIVASWHGEDLPFLEELMADPFGGLAFTQSYVVAPERVEREDERGETLFADELPLPPDIAALTGFEHAWVTRIDTSRDVSEHVEDTRFVSSPTPVPVDNEIQRTRTVRIASACCPDSGIPNLQRTFEVTTLYRPGEEPDEDSYFYCAPPPDYRACGLDEPPPPPPDDPFADDPGSAASWGCGYDPDPPPPSRGCGTDPAPSRSRGCCGGRCDVRNDRVAGLHPFGWAALLVAGLAIRARRRRR